ncbi:MAG: VanZ like family protein [Bacillales bacterium]|jgi:VanZ family protein|nr:VanZ like family protein [Bacillales bacterium]
MNRKIFNTSWIVVLVWMTIIFYLSHQPATQSNELSTGITEIIFGMIKDLLPSSISESINLNHYIRKTAHFTAYFILGFLIENALKKRFIYTLLFCILYAISDEVHQAFIPGRGPGVIDVLIDSTGAFFGILSYKLLFKRKLIKSKN